MNTNSKYYNEYYAYILDKVEPNSKTKKAVFNIIADLNDRRGLKYEFNNIDGEMQDDIIETWMQEIDRVMA